MIINNLENQEENSFNNNNSNSKSFSSLNNSMHNDNNNNNNNNNNKNNLSKKKQKNFELNSDSKKSTFEIICKKNNVKYSIANYNELLNHIKEDNCTDCAIEKKTIEEKNKILTEEIKKNKKPLKKKKKRVNLDKTLDYNYQNKKNSKKKNKNSNLEY